MKPQGKNIMSACATQGGHNDLTTVARDDSGRLLYLWSPYVIGQTIIFLHCDFYLSSFFFFSSPNLSGRRLDVYHTSTHGVALMRI